MIVPKDADGGEIVADEDGNFVVVPSAAQVEVDIRELPDVGNVIVPATVAVIKGVPRDRLVVKIGDVVVPNAVFAGGDIMGFSTELSENGYAIVDGETIRVKPEFGVTSDGMTEDAPVAVGNQTFAVGVKTIPGLKYTLRRSGCIGGEFTNVEGATSVRATSGRLSLKDEDKPDGMAFYMISVDK